ncbi:MAG TPA: M23 family metallopeptidase [Candidatus Saccharimonadales bacterium]
MARGSQLDYKNDQDSDNRLNPADLLEHEKIAGYNRHNDGLDDHPIAKGDASGVSGDLSGGKNIDSVRDRESENPMNSSFTGDSNKKSPVDFKMQIKRKGPLAGILMLLGVGGIGITGLLSPSLLFMQITDMFTNNFNDAHTALTVRTNVHLGKKVAAVKNAFSESSDGKCNIKCKFGSMSDGLKRNLEAKGFHVEPDGDSKLGRWSVKWIAMPDGTRVESGAKFKEIMKNPLYASQFNRVYSSKTAYFMNTKFGNMLKTKLGLTKAFRLAGESKAKFNASFRKALNLPETAVTTTPNPNASYEEQMKNTRFSAATGTVMKLATKMTSVVGWACLGYDVARATSAAVKVAKYAMYAQVFFTLVTTANHIKAGNTTPEDELVITEMGNKLTSIDPSKTDGSGVAATDSYGYKTAAYGDTGAIPDYAKAHSMESSGLLGVLSSMVFLASANNMARSIAHLLCKAGNSLLAPLIQCAPTVETVIGYIACFVANVAASEVIGDVVSKALPLVVAALVAANMSDIDENTKGAILGDVLNPGASSVLGSQAGSYGMAAGSKDEISTYVAAGEEIRKQDEAIARINAKEEPFDIYNQYSFLGSMVRNMNVAAYTNSSMTSTANLLMATIPQSIASLIKPAHAGTYMPLATNKAEQYGRVECPVADLVGNSNAECCPALRLVGAVGDAYCMPSYVASNEQLASDPEATLDFMINGQYIDENTGEPRTDTDQGKQFQKYLDNCPFRVDAPGETSLPVGNSTFGDYDWYIGAMCNKDTDDSKIMGAAFIYAVPVIGALFPDEPKFPEEEGKKLVVQNDIKNFRNYAMDEPVNATLNGEDSVLKHSPLPADPNGGSGTPPVTGNSGNVVTDGWSFPTTAGAGLVSPFGPRVIGGVAGFHTGIDLNVPSGAPFYATRDGVVETREFDIRTYLGGGWCPVAPSESPIQKDIWIRHDVNGVPYTSIYAHMSQFLVANGATVKAGDLIGYTGGSGCSTGPHVHFEIWQTHSPNPGVASAAALDPWPLINP